jgi:hypothetical protein
MLHRLLLMLQQLQLQAQAQHQAQAASLHPALQERNSRQCRCELRPPSLPVAAQQVARRSPEHSSASLRSALLRSAPARTHARSLESWRADEQLRPTKPLQRRAHLPFE